MHRTVTIIAALLVVGLARAADVSTSPDNRHTEDSKDVTVNNLV